jgi:hypothetical protein
MSFKFDERALRRAVQPAIDKMARDMTREMNQLSARYAGRPVAEIKPALQRLFGRDGGSITDPELTEYAEAISAGTRIEFKADRIR